MSDKSWEFEKTESKALSPPEGSVVDSESQFVESDRSDPLPPVPTASEDRSDSVPSPLSSSPPRAASPPNPPGSVQSAVAVKSPPSVVDRTASVPRYLPPVAPPQSAFDSPPAHSGGFAAPQPPPMDGYRGGGKTNLLGADQPLGVDQPLAAERSTIGSGSRWGWRALIAFLAGGLISAGSFSAYQFTEGSSSVPFSSQSAAPIDVSAAGGAETPLVPADAGDPIPAVASALGPSVVQVELGPAVGSGVVYGDGLVITNAHVVAAGGEVLVRLADGTALPAKVVGTGSRVDIAVLSVEDSDSLPVARLALDSQPEVGQLAVAIGSPFQLQRTVTAGIVSAVNRPVPGVNSESITAMIQTDAPINPGNSGGALANRVGEVIGINTAIRTDGVAGGSIGVGFAIPIDTAKRLADLIVAGEPIEDGFLGVRAVTPEGGESGVSISEITPGAVADEAGLQLGDRVLSVNGAPVTQFVELAGLIAAFPPGEVVTLLVERGDEQINFEITLGTRP